MSKAFTKLVDRYYTLVANAHALYDVRDTIEIQLQQFNFSRDNLKKAYLNLGRAYDLIEDTQADIKKVLGTMATLTTSPALVDRYERVVDNALLRKLPPYLLKIMSQKYAELLKIEPSSARARFKPILPNKLRSNAFAASLAMPTETVEQAAARIKQKFYSTPDEISAWEVNKR